MYNAKNLTLDLPDMQLDYIRFGKGEKSLIMIQGLNTRGIKGAAIPLAFMYRLFAKDYTVYLFDRRPNVCPGITARDMAADIAAAMDALGLKDAAVFGVSQGGMIAQYLALDRPDLVGCMVLAVTLSRSNDTLTEVITRWIGLAEENRMRELIRDMAVRMYSDTYLKRYRLFMPLLTLLQKPKDVRRFSILAKSCLTCDTYESLSDITCPVLVLGGERDRIVTARASHEIAERIGCGIHMYENLGHAAYEEAKDFNRRVYDFLSEKQS